MEASRVSRTMWSTHRAVLEFAESLRALRAEAGNPSYRTMAARAHYSRTALSEAASGRRLPTLAVTLAYATACGADPATWTRAWHQAAAQVATSRNGSHEPVRVEAVRVEAAGPSQPVEDGADPERAGCHHDAATVHARKLAITTYRIAGQVELRYSASTRAAWSRFAGYPAFDHLAKDHDAEILVQIERRPDGRTVSFRHPYCFDVHWSDLIVLAPGQSALARAELYLDKHLVASGDTGWHALA